MIARRVAWLLALAALALAACSKPARLAPLPTDAVILAFGDSLTFGTGASEEQSYPVLLEKLLKRPVVRSGVPGEVSREGLARLPEVLDEVRPRLMILCHGGNDLLGRTGEAAAEANLRAMVALARGRGIAVVLVGVPKPGLLLSTADFYGRIAKDLKLPYEAKALASILSDNALKSDPAHPNAEGYRRLAEALAKLLADAGAV